VITAAACIAVALVSYRVVEEPWLNLRRRWARTTLEAQAAAGGSG
jgi:peptidoglycan/LPS O-acetylase OafA/YrhL